MFRFFKKTEKSCRVCISEITIRFILTNNVKISIQRFIESSNDPDEDGVEHSENVE